MQSQRRLERGERELVDPKRARHRMRAEKLDGRSRSGDQPGLRSPEQLVARKADDIGSSLEAAARRRLVAEGSDRVWLAEHSRAEVVDHPYPALARDRAKLLDRD